ncbi:MAG: tetratricopeptide repeat protein [Alphaproteobacteria bacterium]|nr:tetratricopeptide repeat protein [Alphaproteobacteria bacterium]
MRSPVAEKFLSLGVALHRERRFAEAEAYYRQALELDETDADIRLHLAESLREQDQFEEALHILGDAGTSSALNARGLALADLGRLAEALPLLSQAVKLAPSDPDPLVNLAHLVARMSRAEEAMGYFIAALKLAPLHVGALTGLGLLERDLRHFDNAAECLRRTLKQEPQRAPLWNNLALVLDEMGERVEAEAAYRKCLSLDPNAASARCNLGMTLLAQGNLEEGFKAYEARWQRSDMPPRSFAQPQWQGEPLAGKTILLHAEQCLGDSLHFCRYAPLVKSLGAERVLLEVQPPLADLMRSLKGVDLVLRQNQAPLPDFDCHCPLLSLPTLFATSLDTIPASIPYLSPDPILARDKRDWLRRQSGLKIGLAWQGNAKFRGEDWRSPGLALLARALRVVPKARLVCLQSGGRSEFLKTLGEQALDLGHEVDSQTAPFAETAALMAGLDLVISSDTSVPHLAGALGVPTWMALPMPAEWRWLEGRTDSPWYPSLRLFRQHKRDDWVSVERDLANALQEWGAACG